MERISDEKYVAAAKSSYDLATAGLKGQSATDQNVMWLRETLGPGYTRAVVLSYLRGIGDLIAMLRDQELEHAHIHSSVVTILAAAHVVLQDLPQ